MENLADLTPEQLEAILGTDYEVILADALRQKAEAEARANERREIGQVGDGQVFFDPAGAIENVITRRRAGKDAQAAQGVIDKALGDQKTGRRTYAEALLGQRPPQAPVGPPREANAALPPQTAPEVPPMAPGAPQAPTALGGLQGLPALQNAQTLPPDRLQAAGVPPDVQALLAKLRGR